ncbi:DUF4350 domain-containing protein [Tsuneonella rigui]|uniref:DUF4350 domain-containing protein n=1 Tax=Tsuneonella rigui TaxID=1708790 RepID=UPI000F7F69F5|nr:DUF4350 domain-containing protein [Tsuneonella rigui]
MSGSFNPRTVLALVLFGALSFVALLWFIGKGDTGPGPENGAAHAAGHGLAGYAGLAAMLEKQGYDVSLSRSPGQLEDEALLVLTPPTNADPDEIVKIIEARRYSGPTLLILPKWLAVPAPPRLSGARNGWVQLLGASAPGWTKKLGVERPMTVKVASLSAAAVDWDGLGLTGQLPDRKRVLGLDASSRWVPLVRDSEGRNLIAYANDQGCYPLLEEASGTPPGEDCDGDKWNLTVVVEPDLLNNYGLADRNRARLAAKVIELAREGQDIPIVFDLTLNGLGASKNLLTLAFAPPFLAATLCLILALAVVAWRAFGRFGPPLAEARSIAFGKARLAANAAGFIRRSGRLHLLGPPYVALVARRLASAFGLRSADPSAIDAALARCAPDAVPFSQLAARLESARGPSQTLRAAHALKSLERTVAK